MRNLLNSARHLMMDVTLAISLLFVSSSFIGVELYNTNKNNEKDGDDGML